MESQEKMCRICLSSGSHLDFTQIYANHSEIALKLYLISGISIVELMEYNIPAFICQICLKELYQCFVFRKKCQNAAEFFKTQTHRIESELWRIEEEIVDDHLETDLKLEPYKVESIEDEEVIKTSFGYIQDDEDVQETDEYFTDVVVEEIEEIKEETENIEIQKSPKKSRTKVKNTRTNLTCKYCGVTLSRRNRLIQHERLHVLDQTRDFYECFYCGKSFNQKFGLIPHFKNFHKCSPGGKEKWKCAICVDKILPPGNLAIHYEKEHSNFCYKATKNLKGSVIKTDLSERKSQTRKRQKKPKLPKNFWPCSICGSSFSNNSRYQKHLREIHEVSEEQVIQETAALKHHVLVANESLNIKTNHGPKFPCTTCGKIFASAMTVRAHEKIHLNLEFKCDLCAASFRVKAYLSTHMQRVHLKLRKFKCSIENCTKTFVHRELLNYHVRKHLNIRNYACKYCGKTFVTNSCCKIHERIHTDERPYSCKYCEKTFIHHSDHRRHELRHINLQKEPETATDLQYYVV